MSTFVKDAMTTQVIWVERDTPFAPDVAIGEEIRNDIAVCESLADAGRFDLTVTDGVVTLTGRPRSRQQGRDIVRRARHVQGVVAVRDRLDSAPPGPDDFDVLTSFPMD
jgi:hypothetical protein